MKKRKYVTFPGSAGCLSARERKEAVKASRKYGFKATPYYLNVIKKSGLLALKKIVIPSAGELSSWGTPDPSREAAYTVMPGLQHKYDSTALMLVSGECASICRYCFRKRIFQGSGEEVLRDYAAAYRYIKAHPEITNVLLTGGDPLMLPTKKLRGIISPLRRIKHLSIIRIGTKMTAFDPDRILKDGPLLDLIKEYSLPEKRIYVINHFDHPGELTKKAVASVAAFIKAGAITANQTPLIRGVNDDPKALAGLFRKLSFIGATPYYVFQCRPTMANRHFTIPIERGYAIFEKARSMVSGLAKRARFVMSTASGKIHIIGLTDTHVIFKYFRAADNKDSGKLMMFKRNPRALWFDDYEEASHNCPLLRSLNTYGPD